MFKKIDSLYLHFPFCKHLCNYCDFYKTVSNDPVSDISNFHHYLEKSFTVHKSLIETHGYNWAPLKTFYIGGGTPSLWGIEGGKFLKEFFLKHNIALDKSCEFTIEVNPGAWSEKSIEQWQELGVNRFSLGVQTLNSNLIPFLDRVHTLQDVYDTLNFFSKKNLNFSADLMLGLPFSKTHSRNVTQELKEIIQFSPSHFSVYILTVKDNYKHFAHLPEEEWIENEFLSVSEFLKSNSFIHYEVSNFAKSHKESVHNLNYWDSKTVAALGPSATGLLSEERIRYKWKTKNEELDIEILSEDQMYLEKIYMGLRSNIGIPSSALKDKKNELLKKWNDLNYLESSADIIKLNSKGYLHLDSLMDDLFSRKVL